MPTKPHVDDERVCEHCDAQIDLDDWVADKDCCEDCLCDNYTRCSCCEEWTDNDDVRSGEGSNYHNEYCESCYDDNHLQCDCCGCDVANNDSLNAAEIGDYSDYCEDCFSDRFTHCDCCGELYDREDYNPYNGRSCDDRCVNCATPEEWPQKSGWTGCAEYDKVGSSRKFGVELETSDSPDYMEWAHGHDWGAVEDCSVRGMEFVSPALYGNDGYDSVMDFTARMVRNGCDVDEDCGFHLHIDLSDTSANQRKVIALAYHYTRKFWAACIDEDRRDVYYSRYSSGSRHAHGDYWNRKAIVEGNDKPDCHERYVWLNWHAFDRHKTVEVRSHHATCDGREVCNWIKAHTNFVDYVKDMTIGEVTRIFGSESMDAIVRELRFAWNDADLSNYYGAKVREACIG